MSTTAFRHEAGTAIECLSVSCFETYLDGWHLFSNHSYQNLYVRVLKNNIYYNESHLFPCIFYICIFYALRCFYSAHAEIKKKLCSFVFIRPPPGKTLSLVTWGQQVNIYI